jgi:uncharacterized protein (TIGR02145 family)
MKKINVPQVITCLSILFAGLVLSTACKKKSNETVLSGPVPEVVTGNYNNVLLNTVQFAGNVADDHGYVIKKSGFCWSKVNQVPTIQNDTVVASTNNRGSFNDTIKGLKGQTTYYVRAFATNINGTGYGNTISFTTIDSTVADADNNNYRIVQIGSQVWMVENLNTTKFNDGTSIPLIADDNAWSGLSTPGYCWYSNDPTNKIPYRALYNWFTANTGKLAPVGWHIPSVDDWNVLTDFLGGQAIAGGKLKETGTVHWASPNTGATNSTGFTALPGGNRDAIGGFYFLNNIGYFWSSTENDNFTAGYFALDSSEPTSILGFIDKREGYSVRCIRN